MTGFDITHDTADETIVRLFDERWGGLPVIVHGRSFQLTDVELLVARQDGEVVGVLTYAVEADRLEVVSIDSLRPRGGVGRALVDAAEAIARSRGAHSLVCTTTNDNLTALAFWQRVGFRLAAVRPGAVDRSREVKPTIPPVADNGIPIRDEIDLVRPLTAGAEASGS